VCVCVCVGLRVGWGVAESLWDGCVLIAFNSTVGVD
jgi:hypothetical protein